MDMVGSEIGQKMRSAIKAKLTELGCYVDDELPDYVMVMVANKRTRSQMDDDLQLFLGDNTELFVNWLHQVLKKLQEVTVAAPAKPVEQEKSKDKSKVKTKDKKVKEKTKKSGLKKAKKKEKEKLKTQLKKKEKKAHKKKKSKHDEILRPNIPPLYMNIEKESEPSITDVFAGQILKNHGILIDTPKETSVEAKPDVKVLEEVIEPEMAKKPIVPIIDPATILAEPTANDIVTVSDENSQETETSGAPREERLNEINQIEAKIQGLKQKLAEQLDSMSDDEDFLNIRTEAEELMNDFAEDVFQEISQQTASTPPIPVQAKPPIEPVTPIPVSKSPVIAHKQKDPEVLPHIELQLPKRSIRERLGIREEPKKVLEEREKVKEKREKSKRSESPERFTPEREPEFRPPTKTTKSRLGDPSEAKKRSPQKKKHSNDEKSERIEPMAKRLTSKVSVLENRHARASCASVVRVRPRPRVPGRASSLLLRAVADAHKSLLAIPPKIDMAPSLKRALVLPTRRCEPQKILIQVPGNNVRQDDADAQDAISLGDPEEETKMDDVEYIPNSITMKFDNTDYVPSIRKGGRTSTKINDTFIIKTLNIQNQQDKDEDTKFIVTMDGFDPNAFLARRLKTEGVLHNQKQTAEPIETPAETEPKPEDEIKVEPEVALEVQEIEEENLDSSPSINVKLKDSPEKKGVSDTSEESDTQVIIENVKEKTSDIPDKILEIQEKIEKRKIAEITKLQESNPPKRKRSSPIVFDVQKKENDSERTRTESAGSDHHVIVTTTTSSHKYDSLPQLCAAERKPVWCRAFPQCRYGAACAFQHPRCRFAAACSRRACAYEHAPHAPASAPAPLLASHVVPSANFKTISATPLPAMCKYYPTCSNPACHFYHPKPCRYGKTCANKLDCNFYHADVLSSKWR